MCRPMPPDPYHPAVGDTFRKDGITRTLTWVGTGVLLRCKQVGVRGELSATKLGWSVWCRGAKAVKKRGDAK